MIDRDHLARQTAEDFDLQREVLELFLGQLQELHQLLGDGAAGADADAWLHRFRGAAAAVGAAALADNLARAEASMPLAPGEVAELRTVLRQTVADAEDIIAALSRPGLAKGGESH